MNLSGKIIFTASLAVLATIGVLPASLSAQPAHVHGSGVALDEVRALWHEAGVAEARSQWSEAAGYFHTVIERSEDLSEDIEAWFQGTAGFGLAKCYSELGDRSKARESVQFAFEHDFWDYGLLRDDRQINNTVGAEWLDSLSGEWARRELAERKTWSAQEPVMIFPAGSRHRGVRYPLIVALHGGDACYESFAMRWQTIADSVRAIVAVPPGAFRVSQVTNTWGNDMSLAYDVVRGAIKELNGTIDPDSIYLTGFSQGAQAALNLTLLYPDQFRGVIGVSGFSNMPVSDSMLRAVSLRGNRFYEISGEFEAPQFHREIVSFRDRLRSAAIPFVFDEVPGMIHEIPLDFTTRFLKAWRWVR